MVGEHAKEVDISERLPETGAYFTEEWLHPILVASWERPGNFNIILFFCANVARTRLLRPLSTGFVLTSTKKTVDVGDRAKTFLF